MSCFVAHILIYFSKKNDLKNLSSGNLYYYSYPSRLKEISSLTLSSTLIPSKNSNIRRLSSSKFSKYLTPPLTNILCNQFCKRSQLSKPQNGKSLFLCKL